LGPLDDRRGEGEAGHPGAKDTGRGSWKGVTALYVGIPGKTKRPEKPHLAQKGAGSFAFN